MRVLAPLLALALGLAAQAPAARADEPQIFGTWQNPKNSVHLEIRRCGQGEACGVVVWASPKAQADALKGSGQPLLGSTLFRELRPGSDGVWKGKVFVPDLNKTFSGSAQVVEGGGALQAKGCFIGNLLCKSQTWRRVG
ncbi:MAG: DUF2147 domain-containing protein [Caulobacterales bacterium]|nr:DUF2147 domain-containing protein [Caulobacterales bacterium]